MRALVLVLAALVQQGKCGSPRSPRDSGTVPTKHANPLWESTWTDKLKQDLLLSYDKFARPGQHGNKTSVTLELNLHHLDLDEKKSILSIHCYTRMVWIDEKLKWDASKYNGLQQLHLADHEIWQPDIYPYNTASGSSIDHYGNTNLIAYGNGSVLWVPPSLYHVFCQLDFTMWPFDTQVCNVEIGSWTYDGNQLNLTLSDGYRKENDLTLSAEWELVKVDAQRNEVIYSCCPEPYITITFAIEIKRHSATYKALIITPVSAIVLMTLATFWLPPTSGDKITLGGAAVVTTCLFLLYFTQRMPSMAGKTPYIVVFYSRCLYLISLAIVISVMVINLAKNPKTSSLPWIVKKNLTGWLGKCLLIKNSDHQSLSKAEELTDSQPVLTDQIRQLSEGSFKGNQKDWVMLATAIDRICFLLYCFAFIVLALTYSV